MGLDMYLNKRVYVGAGFDHRQVKGTIDLTAYGEKIPVRFERVSEIVEEVGYWRKANAIHKWFVDNVQDGNDDCRDYYVSIEKLEDLLDTCKKVMPRGKLNYDKALELLPPESGFFFGSTDIDKYYEEDIKKTIKILKEALKESKEGSFYYTSSW